MRSIALSIVVLALAGLAPASAQYLVEHAPYNVGGSTSDLDFRDNFGMRQWQQAADDFRVPKAASIFGIDWWGFYRQDNPPTSEEFRIRFYASRVPDDLPGLVLYEQTIANPSRSATGRSILISGSPREFRFHASLPVPMELIPGELYWLEVTQLGDIGSWYFWEFALANQDGRAAINSIVPDWIRSTDPADLAFRLIVPEPATAMFLALGTVLAAGLRARGRNRCCHA
jgi:hypothetical protein